MYCKNCGSLINDEHENCTTCGVNLNENHKKKRRIIPYIIIFILSLIIILIISVYASYYLTKNVTNENFAQKSPEYAQNVPQDNLSATENKDKTDSETLITDKLRSDALAFAESFFEEDFGSTDVGMLEEDLFLISIYWPDGDWACSIEAEVGSDDFEIHEISNILDEIIKEKKRMKKEQEKAKKEEEKKAKKS